MGKRILITGGAGFVGSRIADRLCDKNDVLVVDNLSSGKARNIPKGRKFHPCDIREHREVAEIFGNFNPDVVYHQAAQVSVARSVKAPAEDASINVTGTLNCLEAAKEAGVSRFIFASSGGTLYGEVGRVATEDAPLFPECPYGISKLTGENYCKFYASEKMPVIVLRYSNVYGPGQDPDGEAGVIAIFAKKMWRGKKAKIYGTGGQVRDYVHVDDVARANELALEASVDEFTTINIGTGKGTSVAQVAFLVNEAGKKLGANTLQYEHEPERRGDLQRSLICPNRANKILGWKPRIGLDEGIEPTVESLKGV